MLSSYIVASFVLVGLSSAYPRQNRTAPAPTQAATSTSTFTSSIAPTTASASLNDQLPKRKDPSRDDEEWDEVAKTGIKEGGDIISDLFGLIPGLIPTGGIETEHHTITVTHIPGPTNIPEDPSPPTITQPGDDATVTTTLTLNPGNPTVTNTVVSPPTPTETNWPHPDKPGCGYHVGKDGILKVGSC